MAKVLLLVDAAYLPDTGLQSALDARLAGDGVRFAPDPDHTRSMLGDPTVLVAIVTGVATVLTSIIGAVSTLAANARDKAKPATPAGIIRVQAASGAALEFPADTPPERIAELVEQIQKLDTPTVRIALIGAPAGR